MGADYLSYFVGWITTILSTYGLVAVYLATFLFGENGILAAFILAAQGYLSPESVFVYALLGSLSADVFWFWVSRVFKSSYEKRFPRTAPEVTSPFLLRMADKHTFLFLTFIKFLFGMRIFFTLYILLKKHISFTRYLLINVVGTVLFIGVLFPIGWFLGKGLESAFLFEKGFRGVLSTLVVVLILAHAVPRIVLWLSKRRARASADISNESVPHP
uniref:DedA membrane associated protein n=1 Tax=uncultured bacterium CSLC2 TaxID=1091571 RepID=G4WVS5_9BACT|nr:DedA membrane associated protein [uncultured bacterium CSLC2]